MAKQKISMTKARASAIQRAAAVQNGGTVPKNSFAARAQSAADRSRGKRSK